MSTYYYLYDAREDSLSPILYAQQAWGMWISDDKELFDWLSTHSINNPFIVDEHSERVYEKWEREQIEKSKLSELDQPIS